MYLAGYLCLAYVCAGSQTMGALTSSWGNSEACLWVHNRVAVPLVIGNNSPSSPGSGVVNSGLGGGGGSPLRGPTAGAIYASSVLSETGNEWQKEAETTLCCQTTGLIEVWVGSHRSSSLIKKEKRRVFFLSQSVCKLCSHGTMQFLSQHPQESKLQTFSLRGKRKRERREGSSLTIAAWADINLCKLMEVSILLCYGGMSSIPGHLLWFHYSLLQR